MNYLVFLRGIPVGPLDPVGEGPGVVVAAGGPPRVQRVYQRPVAVRTRPCTAKKTRGSSTLRIILCVQEVNTPIYIMSYYINWGIYFLDTR